MSEERSSQGGEGQNAAFWTPLFLAWLLALLATAGALFLGEVMGKAPCVLCWYQRIAMFPLVLVLGMGLFALDARSVRYALPLAGVGWGIAAYHLLIFWGVVSKDLVPCGKGSSCADAHVQMAGVVPIPLLSLAAFTGILVALWVARARAGRAKA
ncbi:MAG: disulfide bond formation protein B [Aquincola sp.]|uniref:Disulfide bond formation protein B n=1 Tax=Aquincola tertiaricarbonis TaxID=391953 RepID=A0ABY4S6F9_AQUTE|nr:disulfide bond formation protein B [Aquincola tertiaricarbonis]MBQ1762922.1 disulfide bond formation protein B [Aquincola sp.]URI07815.1 disulfide bond formation protein B [Aquincola tertiaricarbonis]